MATGKYLHSHLFSSPLSNNQEVSAFGDEGQSDTGGFQNFELPRLRKSDCFVFLMLSSNTVGDDWKLLCDDDFWPRDAAVRFQHVDTGHFLHMTGQTFGRPVGSFFTHSSTAIVIYFSVWYSVIQGVAFRFYRSPVSTNFVHTIRRAPVASGK